MTLMNNQFVKICIPILFFGGWFFLASESMSADSRNSKSVLGKVNSSSTNLTASQAVASENGSEVSRAEYCSSFVFSKRVTACPVIVLDSTFNANYEPSIAVDPSDHDRIVIGAIGTGRVVRSTYSSDGGLSWTDPIQPEIDCPTGSTETSFDPVLDSYPKDSPNDPTQYALAMLSICNTASGPISVFLSNNNKSGDIIGWSPKASPSGNFSQAPDKPWIAIDKTNGFLYVWYHDAEKSWFNRSVDKGVTWLSSPVQLSQSPPTNKPRFGTTTIAYNGDVFLCGIDTNDHSDFYVYKSTNADDQAVPPSFSETPVSLGGRFCFDHSAESCPGNPNLESKSQVWIASDHTTGIRQGWLYMLCSVDPPVVNGIDDPMDVMFVRSTNGGANWTAPKRVNSDVRDSGSWQWQGTMSVAPNGRIDVVWNDVRDSAGCADSNKSALYYSYSLDGGCSFSTGEALTTCWNHFLKFGEYYHMVSTNDAAHLAFTFSHPPFPTAVAYFRIANSSSATSTDPCGSFEP